MGTSLGPGGPVSAVLEQSWSSLGPWTSLFMRPRQPSQQHPGHRHHQTQAGPADSRGALAPLGQPFRKWLALIGSRRLAQANARRRYVNTFVPLVALVTLCSLCRGALLGSLLVTLIQEGTQTNCKDPRAKVQPSSSSYLSAPSNITVLYCM